MIYFSFNMILAYVRSGLLYGADKNWVVLRFSLSHIIQGLQYTVEHIVGDKGIWLFVSFVH